MVNKYNFEKKNWWVYNIEMKGGLKSCQESNILK